MCSREGRARKRIPSLPGVLNASSHAHMEMLRSWGCCRQRLGPVLLSVSCLVAILVGGCGRSDSTSLEITKIASAEPPRDCRRPNSLRGCGHGKSNEVLVRGERTKRCDASPEFSKRSRRESRLGL